MSFELGEANKKIEQLNEQINQKNEQLSEYRDLIHDLKKQLNLNEIADVLESYLERHPKQKELKIVCSSSSVIMESIPTEIRNATLVGLDYRNSILRMSIENFNRDMQILQKDLK